ncbi:M20 family metallopeptidase [Candidatus Latescibacterota bacterium]
MTDQNTILRTCLDLSDETTSFLDKLVRFESISGYENSAVKWVHEQFSGLADICELVPVPEDIVNDPDYSFRIDDRPYEGRPNVRAVLKGDGTGRSVVFNAHIDVVPPSNDQPTPFDPYIENGVMYGRGTCDDKAQIAVMWTVFKALKMLGIKPKGDVIFHIVIEEETGGNGTLALIREGVDADCCINLEPCGNNIMTSVRGAVWFTGTVYGKAGHSGSSGTTVSALKMAIEAMNIIEEYHDDLLAETIGDDPLFARHDNPMPVTFGELNAGVWPAMAPREAVFKGVFGILTTPKEEVMTEMERRIKTRGPEWLRDNFEITFQYRHDTSKVNPELPFVKTLAQCYNDMGVESEIAGMTASTDGWFYNNILGIPTIATGCGNISDAHTKNEHIVLKDIADESAVLIRFIQSWC